MDKIYISNVYSIFEYAIGAVHNALLLQSNFVWGQLHYSNLNFIKLTFLNCKHYKIETVFDFNMIFFLPENQHPYVYFVLIV